MHFENENLDSIKQDKEYAFNIKRSLRHKGCPYDNAVASEFTTFNLSIVKRKKDVIK